MTRARPLAGLACHASAAHAKRRAFGARLDVARTVIREAIARAESPIVAFSCGKDSSVLAHLVLEQRPQTPLVFLSSGETRLLHDVDTVLDWFRARGATVREILVDRLWTEEWADASWEEQRKAGRGDLDRINAGADCVFMGLRAEESPARRASLQLHRTEGLPSGLYRYRTGPRAGMLRACPLAEWSTDDVTAYIATREIPVLGWYHELGMDARTTARLTGDAARSFALTHLHRTDPDGAHRLISRFPELRDLL